MRKTYIVVISIIVLLSIITFSTYAMFTQDISIGEFVNLTASTLPTESNITEYERITIPASESRTIDLNITNTTSNSLYYGVWYEMVDPSTINSNIKIGILSGSTSATIGQLASNGNITVQICIVNKSNDDIIINIGVGYSSTSSLNLPTGRSIITGEVFIDRSGANSPDLVQGLIPVRYDETNSTWVKADSTNTDVNNKWYDYNNKMWANAVLVKEIAYEENITETNKTVSINNSVIYNPTYTSSNQGVKSSSSINTFTFTTGSSTGTLSFDYSVSSEANYDKLTIKLDNTTLVDAISGTQSSSYSGALAANTTYVLTATYSKDVSQDKNDDQATISNIQISNISGSITVGSSGSYPWTGGYEYPVNTYTSYQFQDDGNYTLTGKNNVQASDTIGRYICSDTTSTTCTTMYKITGYSSNTINKVDSYGVNSFSARSTYSSGSVGTQIKESAVLAYYVWIPRYKYKVFNINKVINTDSYNAKTTGIDIVFENETQSTGTVSCNYNFAITDGSLSEICTGNNGDYYTHPAFTFGTTQVRGIWVGKFEISSETPDVQTSGYYYGGGNVTNLTVRVKPNVTSWRYNYLSNFYKVIYDMQTTNNIYGLSTNRSNTDSHMLKNIEWGAVAYLTNSKHGRCTNNTCTEVSINNSSDFITGNAGNNAYNTTTGQLASTTGNIYGIYDMSGGAHEFVMANMSNAAGSYTYNAVDAGSNYTYTGNEKYIDTYANGSSNGNQTAYNRSRLGDATGETKGWYSDSGGFVNSSSPWFCRGGFSHDTDPAGTFNFVYEYGYIQYYISARSALLLTSN